MVSRSRSASGFSLVEALVGGTLLLVVMATVLAAVVPAHDAFVAQPEAADLQQRLRVAVDRIGKDLVMAGAGDGLLDGALYRHLAPVRPYRIGDARSDAAAGVHYRPDAISVVYAPVEREATAREIIVGARRVSVVTHTYYLRAVPRSGAFQLVHYDGRATDLPVIDDLVGLSFEYLGDPWPPVMIPGSEEGASPRASYGPTPPPPGVDDPADTWGAGENCTFIATGDGYASRLPPLAAAGALQRLEPAVLTDGPWCPDPAAREPFDADLLRIRRILVRVRVQARAAFRGPAGALFAVGGVAGSPARYVPDREARFEVSPRNVNLER
jgi:hypothetical protein